MSLYVDRRISSLLGLVGIDALSFHMRTRKRYKFDNLCVCMKILLLVMALLAISACTIGSPVGITEPVETPQSPEPPGESDSPEPEDPSEPPEDRADSQTDEKPSEAQAPPETSDPEPAQTEPSESPAPVPGGSAPPKSETDPEPVENLVPPELSVPSSMSASIHRAFEIQSAARSVSTPEAPVELGWSWLEGEFDVSSRTLPRITSHEPVSFYDAFGTDEITVSVVVDLPNIDTALDEPFTLTIEFVPALEKDDALARMGSLFGGSYYVHYDDGLVFTGVGVERMVEVPDSFDVWSDGVRHSGELVSFAPEEHVCVDIASASVRLNGVWRAVKINTTYTQNIDGSDVEYRVSIADFNKAEPHLSQLAIRFEYDDNVSVYAFKIDAPRTIVLGDLEFEASVPGVVCETELVSERTLDVRLGSQSASLDAGDVFSSGEAALFVEDINHIKIPAERTSATIGFAPERFVLQDGSAVERMMPAGTSWSSSNIQGTRVTLDEQGDFISAVVIEYTPKLHGGTPDLIEDVVFGSFEVRRLDEAYRVRDTGALRILDDGLSFRAYATLPGTYTIVATATESGRRTSADTIVTVG